MSITWICFICIYRCGGHVDLVGWGRPGPEASHGSTWDGLQGAAPQDGHQAGWRHVLLRLWPLCPNAGMLYPRSCDSCVQMLVCYTQGHVTSVSKCWYVIPKVMWPLCPNAGMLYPSSCDLCVQMLVCYTQGHVTSVSKCWYVIP